MSSCFCFRAVVPDLGVGCLVFGDQVGWDLGGVVYHEIHEVKKAGAGDGAGAGGVQETPEGVLCGVDGRVVGEEETED